MTGFDQSYTPAAFVTESNDDVYVSGVKYDSGIGEYINKLYKSTDQGVSWSEISTTGLINIGKVYSLAVSGNNMILCLDHVNSLNGTKIFTSADHGSTWALSMTGFDQSYKPADFVTDSNGDVYLNGYKFDSGIGGYINKLYKSIDQGVSWSEISTTGLTNLGYVNSLEISGNKMILGGIDVVGANGGKIFTSTDDGSTWTLSMTGFDQTYTPADFTTDSNGDIYINGVKYDNGVGDVINKFYKSTNQGTSWTEFTTTGLPNIGNIYSLEISGNNMVLGLESINATTSNIFTSPMSTLTEIRDFYNISDLVTIYPNPFIDKVNLDFNPNEKLPNTIKIVTITGELVLSNDSFTNQNLSIETENLNSGMYFLIIEYGKEIKTLKIIK